MLQCAIVLFCKDVPIRKQHGNKIVLRLCVYFAPLRETFFVPLHEIFA